MRILLVEDDPMLGKAIKNILKSENYAVDWMTDYESSEVAIMNISFDVIVLDINLPDKSGLELLKKLRSNKKTTPVLILTARDSVLQKVEGLDLGADDYMSKPFDSDELLARIRAISRRDKGIATPNLQYKNISLNPVSCIVKIDEKIIDLTAKEFMLLKIFLENMGKVISRAKLEESLYDWDSYIESNAIEVHIHNLRKKFGINFIKTVRGIGYTISD